MKLTFPTIAALLAVYVIWGSTYLAIAVLLETAPPFLSACVRFVVAGGVMMGYARLRGAPAPERAHWRHAIPLGALFFLGGNGGVVWGEQLVPSGLTALIIALVPMWVALHEMWLLRQAPTLPRALGLVLGTLGIGVLVGGPGEGKVDPLGALALVASAASWGLGTVLARKAHLPSSSAMTSGMEMLAGGVLLGLAGLAIGELPVALSADVDPRGWLAFLWLLLGGSLIGFTAYQYLLQHTSPAVASTYAYVNPVVAVLLGWWIADEALGPRVFVAGALIVTAVVAITTFGRPRHGTATQTSTPSPGTSNASS